MFSRTSVVFVIIVSFFFFLVTTPFIIFFPLQNSLGDLKNARNFVNNLCKDEIQSSLNQLATAKINKLKIGTKIYQLDQLLAKDNLKKPYGDLSEGAKEQFAHLFKVKGEGGEVCNEKKINTAVKDLFISLNLEYWKEKKMKELEKEDKKLLIFFLFSKPKEKKVVVKDKVYKFDQVFSALENWIKEGKTFYKSGFTWDSILEQAGEQIIQFYKQNDKSGLKKAWTAEYKKIMADTWNDIQSLIYKMRELSIWSYKDYQGQDIQFYSPFVLTNEWDFFKKRYSYQELEDESRVSMLFEFNHFFDILLSTTSLSFTKKTFTAALDQKWLTKLQFFQTTPDLINLEVGKENVDVSSLTSSNAQSIANLSKEQTDTLAKLMKLDDYKKKIQDNLNALAVHNISQIKVGHQFIPFDVFYVDLLHVSQKIKEGEKNYFFHDLLAKDNLNKSGLELPEDARTQLNNLMKDRVTKTQLSAALNQILTTRKTQVQKEKEEKAATTKKAKDKKTALTIGLAAGGGVLLLAGGFLYWFYKIKK